MRMRSVLLVKNVIGALLVTPSSRPLAVPNMEGTPAERCPTPTCNRATVSEAAAKVIAVALVAVLILSFVAGELVPIPTLPASVMRRRSEFVPPPLVLNNRLPLTLVPSSNCSIAAIGFPDNAAFRKLMMFLELEPVILVSSVAVTTELVAPLLILKSPPATSNLTLGELVPIPTFPLASLYNCPEPMLMTLVSPVKPLIAGFVRVLLVRVCVPDTLTAVAPPKVVAAGKVAVPVTAKVFPEPTFRPTDVPVPSPLKMPSIVSKSVLILPPHVSVDAPTSGLTRLRLVVFVSAIALPL